MATVRTLRFEAGLTVSELARRADVSRSTIEKVERGESIRGDMAGKICRALSEKLGRPVTIQDAQIQTSFDKDDQDE